MKPDQDMPRAAIPEPMALSIFSPRNRPRRKTAALGENLIRLGSGCRAKPINFSLAQEGKRLLGMSDGQDRAGVAENSMGDVLTIGLRASGPAKGTGDGGPDADESCDVR